MIYGPHRNFNTPVVRVRVGVSVGVSVGVKARSAVLGCSNADAVQKRLSGTTLRSTRDQICLSANTLRLRKSIDILHDQSR